MPIGRQAARNDERVPKTYPARLYLADSGEPISALVSIQGDQLFLSAVDTEHLHKFEASRAGTSGDNIAFLLSSLQVRSGGSEGDKVVLVEPDSETNIVINSHDFLSELRLALPNQQIKGNFNRLKFNRFQSNFRNSLVAVGMLGAVLLFTFVVATAFLYESKHPHRDDVSLSEPDGEGREASDESSSEAQEPVSEDDAITYNDGEEMSEEANEAAFKYLTNFRTKVQSKLRKLMAKPMVSGTVVELAITASGNLVNSAVAQSAGVDNDKLVLKAVRSCFPLKPLPKGVQSPLRAEILIK